MMLGTARLGCRSRSMATVAAKTTSASSAATAVSSAASDRSYQFLQECSVPTDKFMASLPRMPIPKLEVTCGRYLDSQRPMLSPEDYARTEAAVKEFENGLGRELDSRLRAIDKANKETSYINGPWTDVYLKDRRPVVFTHDPGMLFDPKDPRPEFRDAAMRAANVLVSSLRFHRSLASNMLFPEVYHMVPAKTKNPAYWSRVRFMPGMVATPLSYLMKVFPLDMSQCPNLFQSTRIPKVDGRDEIRRFPDSKHVVVMRKGHFFAFDVYDRDGCIFPPSYYLKAIRGVIAESEAISTKSSGIGVLTGSDRDAWAVAREHLVERLGNGEALEKIDSALYAISLDDDHWHHQGEETLMESVMETIGGSHPENRWFDKSFGMMFASTGDFGLRFEHSWGDGVAVMRFCDDVVNDARENTWVSPNDDYNGDVDIERLDIVTDAKIDDAVAEARKGYFQKLNSVDNFVFKRFGRINKGACKKAKVAPDSVMQVLFQIAYSRLTGGSFAATYESCSTAIYRQGRTETVRPLTREAAEVAEAFNSPESSRPEKGAMLELLRKCSKRHSALTASAAQAQGWDRHLFALRHLAKQENLADPSIFCEPSYAAINRIILSTSTLASPNIVGGGFCPVQPDGFGIPYQINEDGLGVVVTSFKGGADGKGLRDAVESVVDDLEKVLL